MVVGAGIWGRDMGMGVGIEGGLGRRWRMEDGAGG